MNNRIHRYTPLHRQRQLASYNSLDCSNIQTLHLYKTESSMDGVQDMPYQDLGNLPPMLHLEQLVISVLKQGGAAGAPSTARDNNDEFYRTIGQFVLAHPGKLSRLKLFVSKDILPSSLAGLIPALERVTWFELSCGRCGRLDHMSWIPILYDLADLVGECHSLQRFSCHTTFAYHHIQALCHLLSRFPRLKHVQFLSVHEDQYQSNKTSVYTAVLNMVLASTSIEVIDGCWHRISDATQQAVIAVECRNNRIRNRIRAFHENGIFTDPLLPSSIWTLILHKYSDEEQPDAIYYLLQQMHDEIIPNDNTSR